VGSLESRLRIKGRLWARVRAEVSGFSSTVGEPDQDQHQRRGASLRHRGYGVSHRKLAPDPNSRFMLPHGFLP
jgi:hypothetical protein